MCLAIPMRVVSMEGLTACCDARGIRRDVSLTLLGEDDAAVGDYVLVHVGYALQKITATDAKSRWELFDEITSALDHIDA